MKTGMHNMQSKIEQQVMAGVGAIYTARQLVSATALKLYVCVLSLYGIGRLVWVSRVWENLSHVGLQNAFNFALSAVTHTHLPVQIALAAFVVAGVWFVADLVKKATEPDLHFA